MKNAQCKKARNSYYNKNIADVQQSNPKQWCSAVKKISGLSTPKIPKTLIYNDCTYQGEDLAKDQAQAWLSSISCINVTKHVMILDHHYGSSY